MLVQVALPVPVPGTFTYRAAEPLAPGTRVRVPFSGRQLVGWVVGPGQARPELTRLRDVDRVLDDAPSLPPDLLELCRWISDYYVTPLGIVLRAALPAPLSRPTRSAPPATTQRVLRITRELPSLQERDELFGRAVRQRECYEVLEAAGGSADVAHLTDALGFSETVLRGLVKKGVAAITHEQVLRDPFAQVGVNVREPLRPTPAQAEAIRRIIDTAGARPALLVGVTGSGKTLVYIEVLREVVLRRGRGAIVLVPEIALTPQTVSRFRAEFGDTVSVLHSALSDGERYDAWLALRQGDRRIAIGARSAVFAPVHDLGAIIVDEEHEATYKQSEAPRYHAREVAVMRARAARAICVLGSATPSLESWANAKARKYDAIPLPERIAGRAMPAVSVIDLREKPRGTRKPVIVSAPMRDAILERLDRREQVILLLNRRGYSAFVQCRACGRVWQCRQCNVSLTFHRARRRLICHYCFHDERPPVSCPDCGSTDLSFRGIGTEQVEREVVDMFPAARVARMDVDTTSAKWAHHEILRRFEAGETDILLGTQMIAKGLDFPNVTLVGVINADVAMNLPDFRAGERTFQLLTQVAGRAGRGDREGTVLVQTALPNHYAIRCALEHDYHGFATRELDERASVGYPPFTRLINVVVSGTDEDAVQRAADDAAAWTRAAIRERAPDAVQLIGPAPCPVDRIRGRWRWHFLLRARRATPLGAIGRLILDEYRAPRGGDVRVIIDRDPVSLL